MSTAATPAAPKAREDLTPLLAPKSIAVIGASRRESNMGRQILYNLIHYGFTGSVYPVNPHSPSICSVKAYPHIGELPEAVDVAIVVVPKEHVIQTIEECGQAKAKGLIVISAGFREVGGEGVGREAQLMETVRKYGLGMIGPNCMGVINADPAVAMNATFAPTMPPFGHAAFVSQSGALGLSVLDYARAYGIGISQFVSIGNSPDVDSNDLIERWETDDAVKVILMYVENFGDPRRFLSLAQRITKKKPIIVVKSGRSRAGARAASSHTGALATSDVAVDAMLAQAGVLRASSVEDLFDMAMGFGVKTPPRSRRTALLTNAGGPGILAADAMEAHGLELVELSPQTVEALRPLFPPEASIRNPLDMIASATPAGYKAALTAFLQDPAIDAVVPIFVPPFGVKQEDVCEAIVSAAQTAPDKPMLAVLMGLEGLPQGRAELHEAGMPAYIFPESAARALNALNRWREWAAREPARIVPRAVDRDRAAKILGTARHEKREQLWQVEAIELLRAYGIPVAETRFVAGPTELAADGAAVGYPLAMKLASPDITHKTDVGGVRLGIADEAALLAAYGEMMTLVKAKAPKARIDGVVLQKMVSGGRETIAGIARDAAFGAQLMFGLGGVFVEALSDVVFRIAPVDAAQAMDMLTGIRGAKVLDGVRGAPPVAKDQIAEVIVRLGQLAMEHPEIAELDINPLLAFEHGVMAVDARVRIEV
ncbi:MAG: acetate--CoA ligase family protein [Gemmatimonadetes bacterium]|nr:acetate--CoA ligase family protein [Gemmatimonadota bacterium]